MEEECMMSPVVRDLLQHATVQNTGKNDAFTSDSMRCNLKAELHHFLEPFARRWIDNFRPMELIAECTRIIDGSMKEDEPAKVCSERRSRSFSQSDLHGDGTMLLPIQKDFTPRDGSISRRGRFNDDKQVMDDSLGVLPQLKNRPLSDPSGSLSMSNMFTDSMHDQKVYSETSLSSPRRVSLPRSDSLPSLQGYQPLSRSESIPAKSPRERAECRPPLSKVSRSFSEYVELSPIALESVPEAPSPTKSESSSSKFQTKTVDEASHFLSPNAAKTSRAFAIPEVGKEKKRSLGTGTFDRIVNKWDSMIESKRRK